MSEKTGTIRMPDTSLHGIRAKFIRRMDSGEMLVELLECRRAPELSFGWQIGEKVQIKQHEFEEDK